MRWTALLAVAIFVLAVGSATAAPKAIKGTVVAKRARGTQLALATGSKSSAVTVNVARRPVRLGDRVSVVGKRLRVLSHVQRARIRGMVVKRLAHGLRVASGHSVLTIHGAGRALASRHDGRENGDIGEFEIRFEHGDLVEDGFTPASPAGTVEIEGHLVSVSPLVVSLDGLPIEITVPSSLTLPALTPGQEVELVVQTRTGNTFTLVSIESARANDDENDVEANGPVTDSTASQITVDGGGATVTFAAPASTTLPIVATGTCVEARGVTINGVLTLTRLRTEDGGDNSGDDHHGGGCGDH